MNICDEKVYEIIERIVKSDFKFIPADISDIQNILSNIKSKSDCEHLNKSVIDDAMTAINLQILDAINTSLEYGIVSESWKKSVIIPTPKVNGTMKCEEFRPVNMLPTYEKILEGVVKQQLNEHMDNNNIIIDVQHGFRKNHSCETAINMMLLDWKIEIENGNVIIAVFLDLKRAFETVDRKRLLRKLQSYGINGVELKWFESYLSNRSQCTKYGSATSDQIPTNLGVPQGSKLAADLFILYINDIVNCLKHSKLGLFADDTLIHISGKNLEEAINKLNEDLSRINSWLNVNKLKLNVDKTKYMIINSGKNSDLDNACVIIDGCEIERVNEFRYLGINIDCHLKMKSHVDYISKKVAKKIGFLARISRKLPIQLRILLYKSIISPHFEYCPSILFTCDGNEFAKLQKLQNRAMRVILRCGKTTTVASMLEALCWMSVKQRIMFQTMIQVFRIKYQLAPSCMTRNVNYVRDAHTYPMRNDDDFRLQTVTKTSTTKTIFHKGLQMFNGLPTEIKSENNISQFKRLLATYVKSNY